MSANEFPRAVRLDAVGEAPRDYRFSADPEERAALARRFALPAIETLEVTTAVRRDGRIVLAEGRVTAAVVQACVATGEPLPARIEVPFALRFVPAEEGGTGDEIELSNDDCDTLVYAGGAIDIGEAAAETLLLALDPFPRSAGAGEALKAAGVLDPEEAGPFATLRALRDKLAGQ